jgi:hypothetical protein
MNTKIEYKNGIVDEVSIGNIISSVDFLPIQQVVSTNTAPSSTIVGMDMITNPDLLREMDKQEAHTPRMQVIERGVETYDDAKFKRFKSVIAGKDGITRITWEDENYIAEYPTGSIKNLIINGKLNSKIKERIIKLQ